MCVDTKILFRKNQMVEEIADAVSVCLCVRVCDTIIAVQNEKNLFFAVFLSINM